MIAENFRNIRAEIAECARNSGRDPSSIELIAVSKTFDVESVREAFGAGARDFGENFAQELREKQAQLADLPIRWHFIGHLQTNKVKTIAPLVTLVHSLDSFHLAEEISRRAARANRSIDVLVEVHTTDEATKYGVPPEQVLPLVRDLSGLPSLRVQGLMTMGPFSDDAESSRACFRLTAALARDIAAQGIQGVEMRHLSMGMTHDFRIAIEEGATMIRIGTAIFGKRTKHV
jgi:pyridoxal phosphate enzyme (YggS family)